MLKTIKELSKLLNVSDITMRVWLDNYRFSKYRRSYQPAIAYEIDNTFWETLNDFLYNKTSVTAKKVRKKIALLCDTVETI